MHVISHHKRARNITDPERWFSGFCGGWALAMGIRRGDRQGAALAVLGAELVRRGLTGHSYLYEWVGVLSR